MIVALREISNQPSRGRGRGRGRTSGPIKEMDERGCILLLEANGLSVHTGCRVVLEPKSLIRVND
jgi:hypothetical protein